jgi:iron complex outermembrane receptor protein
MEQFIPTTSGSVSGQWTRDMSTHVLLIGGEGRWTDGTFEETRYSVAGVPSGPTVTGGSESRGALFTRVSLSPIDPLTVVLGIRGDFWQSTPSNAALPEHSAAFFSPRVSASWRLSDLTSLHGAAYRGHRTPTLNELHRGFSVGAIVTNPNPELDPERLTGFEGGALVTWSRVSARLTGFWNELDDAVTNVTISAPGAPIVRQRQNTDTVQAKGIEIEADVRAFERLTLGGVVGLTRSHFASAPAQPTLEGNRVPQVPSYQLGATITYLDPRGFTGSLQARRFGAQFDDDLNQLELGSYGVIDFAATQAVRRGLQVFVAVENLLDADYDVGRTPIRTIGWPRSARVGVRVFLP